MMTLNEALKVGYRILRKDKGTSGRRKEVYHLQLWCKVVDRTEPAVN